MISQRFVTYRNFTKAISYISRWEAAIAAGRDLTALDLACDQVLTLSEGILTAA
jgi:hypothetical protein